MSLPKEPRVSAAQLRQDFDASFARAPDDTRPAELDLLLLTVGARRYAVGLSQVAAVHADYQIVPVPSPDRRLRGLVGLRGGVVPVYDFALVLGHPRAISAAALLELRGAMPCALAFASIGGHLRVPAAALAARQDAPDTARRLVSATVPSSNGPLPLIDLVAVYAELSSRPFSAERTREER